MNNKTLTIGWLYPDLMSTYGDRGNIITLKKRCEWRNIDVTILAIDQSTPVKKIQNIDLIFGGGAQDKQQEIVMQDLTGEKGNMIKQLIENTTPALFVCGAPQLMGKFYEPAEGEKIEGLGIFDMVSKHPGANKPRLIGNVVASVYWEHLNAADHPPTTIVGFENHGGRTYLGKNAKPFARVIKGNGNNGEDGTEGVVYKNAIGCYFHGPLLPKNPHVADWLITSALAKKYNQLVQLKDLDDSLENQAHEAIARKLGIGV